MEGLSLDFSNRDEHVFNANLVNRVIKEAIQETIGNKDYDGNETRGWVESIANKCLNKICKEQKPYKHIVTVMIHEKNGCGLHNANSCLWNADSDGSCSVIWENTTNYVIVSVFGLSI